MDPCIDRAPSINEEIVLLKFFTDRGNEDLDRIRYALINDPDETVTNISGSLLELYSSFENPSQQRGNILDIVCVYWQALTVFSNAQYGHPVNEAVNKKSTDISFNNGLSYLMGLPQRIAAAYEATFSKEDNPPPPHTMEQVSYNVDQLLTNDRAGKLANDKAAQIAKRNADKLIAGTKMGDFAATYINECGETMVNTHAYDIFLNTALNTYITAILSGKKSVCDIVSDKLAKAGRLDIAKHNLTIDDIVDLIDTHHTSPEKLPDHMKQLEEKGARNIHDVYPRVRLLINLGDSLRSLKDILPKVQAAYRSVITDLQNPVLDEAAFMPHDHIKDFLKDYYQELEQPETATAPEPSGQEGAAYSVLPIETLEPTKLNWEVLPPGELEVQAKEIVESVMRRAPEDRRPSIDLNRLNILDQVRQSWGADRSYYARGKLSKRSFARDENLELPDEYIILVLQETDRQGNVVAEHALAESPVAGPHAMYIYRQDCSDQEYNWREIMALDKKDARRYGARSVKHTAPAGVDLVNAMSDKAEQLLTCGTESFHTLRFSGRNRAYIPQSILESALS